MKVSSFDIFDTCLVRLCGTPACFFDVLSYRAFSEPVPESLRQRFVAERREAEHNATVRLGAKTTLADIYAHLPFHHPLLYSKSQLMEREMECEREMLRPVLKMREKVDSLRSKGHHIIFISDMYLPRTFLEDVLRQHAFLKSGDSLYVSCEVGRFKNKGDLFRYVKEKEHLKTYGWTHYGDNKKADIKGPRYVGIKASRIDNAYTSIQQEWLKRNNVNGFHYPGILAGISRALRSANPDNDHKDFVLDLKAPLLCSYVFKVMKEAEERGLSRLFFCARDAYSMYLIAKKMQCLIPDVDIQYLYISRDALYVGEDSDKIAYFKSVGLASNSENVGIVDLVSGGKTIQELNRLLSNHGFKTVYGFFLYKWEHFETEVEYTHSQYELSQAYLKGSLWYDPFIFLVRTQFFENFYGLNNQNRTVGYTKKGDSWEPVFVEDKGSQDGVIPNRERWFTAHQVLIDQYTDAFVKTGVYRYSSAVFCNLALPANLFFSSQPDKIYLKPLLTYKKDSDSPVFIKDETIFRLMLTRGRDSEWRRGTFYCSLPKWVLTMLRNIL